MTQKITSGYIQHLENKLERLDAKIENNRRVLEQIPVASIIKDTRAMAHGVDLLIRRETRDKLIQSYLLWRGIPVDGLRLPMSGGN